MSDTLADKSEVTHPRPTAERQTSWITHLYLGSNRDIGIVCVEVTRRIIQSRIDELRRLLGYLITRQCLLRFVDRGGQREVDKGKQEM